MGAIFNGMASAGLRPFGATFFVFTDYMRPSIRLAAIMGLPVFYVFTHDSIGVGEDGPTHQPIEHLAALRAIPNLLVIRPATPTKWPRPIASVLPLKNQGRRPWCSRGRTCPRSTARSMPPPPALRQGGYVLADAADGKPEVILIGTGSEVSLCVAAYEKLSAEGIKARVVSLPCWELFDAQPAGYRDAVLPPDVTRRVAVELGIEQGWWKYIGRCGRFLGMMPSAPRPRWACS